MFDLDICLCEGKNCIIKNTCLRYIYHLKTKFEDYNTYFETPPIKDLKCDYYIKVGN